MKLLSNFPLTKSLILVLSDEAQLRLLAGRLFRATVTNLRKSGSVHICRLNIVS
jgi:hypothetical protein